MITAIVIAILLALFSGVVLVREIIDIHKKRGGQQ